MFSVSILNLRGVTFRIATGQLVELTNVVKIVEKNVIVIVHLIAFLKISIIPPDPYKPQVPRLNCCFHAGGGDVFQSLAHPDPSPSLIILRIEHPCNACNIHVKNVVGKGVCPLVLATSFCEDSCKRVADKDVTTTPLSSQQI